MHPVYLLPGTHYRRRRAIGSTLKMFFRIPGRHTTARLCHTPAITPIAAAASLLKRL